MDLTSGPYPQLDSEHDERGQMEITIVGHSTVLIESEGQRIITDPFFRTSWNPAYRRLTPPARAMDTLLDVNAVLVSHNHWDHIDGRYFRSLPQTVPVIVPRKMVWLSKLQGIRNCVGVAPWDSRDFGKIKVTAVPAHHLIVTVGFVIEAEGKRVYFAGDTYHGSFMREIGVRFKLDAALMPVTTFRIPMTMGERSAVRAAADLSPKVVIPIHLGIEPRSPLLRTKHSPAGFKQRLQAAGLNSDVVILKEGARWSC